MDLRNHVHSEVTRHLMASLAILGVAVCLTAVFNRCMPVPSAKMIDALPILSALYIPSSSLFLLALYANNLYVRA